jgi:hypothetical protein
MLPRRDRAHANAMKTWVINDARFDFDSVGQKQLVVGLTTSEWIRISGDEARPGDATTFVWIVLDEDDRLLEIGLRPHDHVSEEECLEAVRVLLWVVRPVDRSAEPHTLLGQRLPAPPA